MDSPIEKIKERLSITEIVGEYVKVEKSGKSLRSLCPFHSENTPSFFISPERGTFHCFGCHKSGDVFSFVSEIEGLDFYSTLKLLADRAGVELKTGKEKGKKEEKGRLLDILEESEKFFRRQLKSNKKALKYLQNRGLKEGTVVAFKLGFALEQWQSLFEHLKTKGFNQKDIEEVGLIKDGPRSYYDRFRGRIMFPITNAQGVVVGFTGRLLSDNKKEAKYLNSPESQLFNKSKILYGYDKAKVDILRSDRCILVEGQMDVLLSHQAGFGNTVALSGTALSEHQVKMISRLTENLVIALDSDQAGISASEKSVMMAVSFGLNVSVVTLKEDSDPADMILESSDDWQKAIDQAKDYVDFRLSLIEVEDKDLRLKSKKIKDVIYPYIDNIKGSIEKDMALKKVADALSVSQESAREDFERFVQLDASSSEKNKSNDQDVQIPSEDKKLEDMIAGMFLWQRGLSEPFIDLKKCEDLFFSIVGSSVDEFLSSFSKDDQKLIFQAERSYDNFQNPEKDIEELFWRLKLQNLKRDLDEKMKELRYAEKQNDKTKTEEILKKVKEISEELNKTQESIFK